CVTTEVLDRRILLMLIVVVPPLLVLIAKSNDSVALPVLHCVRRVSYRTHFVHNRAVLNKKQCKAFRTLGQRPRRREQDNVRTVLALSRLIKKAVNSRLSDMGEVLRQDLRNQVIRLVSRQNWQADHPMEPTKELPPLQLIDEVRLEIAEFRLSLVSS